MSSDDEMAIDERRKYLRSMNKRYDQANKNRRGQLLDEQ